MTQAELLVMAPVLWPLFMGALLMALWRHGVWQRWVAVAGSAIHVGFAALLVRQSDTMGTVAVAAGGWAPPFGIAFVADRTGAAMACITAVIGFTTAIYAISGIDRRREAFGFHPLCQVLLGGVCGSFLTGDFFNLYVWFEVMLMASFVLLALGGERKQMAGALQYVAINLVASTIFLIALGLMYGLVGTLNMADVAARLPLSPDKGIVGVVCALLMLAFGIKAAMFPVYTWLPASYHTPPPVVTALFAGLLTKVGVYALLRSSTLVFQTAAPFLLNWMLIIAALTMVFGVVGAVAQNDFRRVLSFHVISQIGYMIFGIALMTPLAIAATVFYVLHHILVKTNLFYIAGIAQQLCGTEQLKRMGGLYAKAPGLTALFFVSAFSLGGIPPLSGFWAKFFLVRAGLEGGQVIIVAVSLVVGLFTLMSMLKLWNEAFWKPMPEEPNTVPVGSGRMVWKYVPTACLAAGTVWFGLGVGEIFAFGMRASADLVDPSAYIQTVLGGSR